MTFVRPNKHPRFSSLARYARSPIKPHFYLEVAHFSTYLCVLITLMTTPFTGLTTKIELRLALNLNRTYSYRITLIRYSNDTKYKPQKVYGHRN